MKNTQIRVSRVLMYLVPIGLLVTAISALTQWWWVLDLFTHFRVQYILFGLLILPLYFWLKQYYIALIITLVVAIHAVSLWPYLHAPRAHAERSGDGAMSIMFANVYYKSEDLKLLTYSISQAEPDVFILAELQPRAFTYLSEYYKTEYPEQEYAQGEGAYDIAIFSKVPTDELKSLYFTPENPSIYAKFMVEDEPLHLLGIHPHSPVTAEYTKMRNVDLQQAVNYVNNLDGAVVVVGDLNTTQFSPFMQQLMKESKLEDTQLEFGLQPSWHSGAPKIFRIPIDHVLVTPEVDVVMRKLGEKTGSDHLPVIVELNVSDRINLDE